MLSFCLLLSVLTCLRSQVLTDDLGFASSKGKGNKIKFTPPLPLEGEPAIGTTPFTVNKVRLRLWPSVAKY